MVMAASDGRPLPRAIPTTQPYFDAAREGRLRLQCCPRDGVFFYPRSHCPDCWQTDWEWNDMSGRGEVYSFTIDRIGHDPALAGDVPFVIALVTLEEGARVVANVVACAPEEVYVGMPVEATFESYTPAGGGDAVALLRFQPRSA
jgi:uncharacterized OB-fold protein